MVVVFAVFPLNVCVVRVGSVNKEFNKFWGCVHKVGLRANGQLVLILAAMVLRDYSVSLELWLRREVVTWPLFSAIVGIIRTST